MLSSDAAAHEIDGETLDFEMIYGFLAMERFFGVRFLQLSTFSSVFVDQSFFLFQIALIN